MSIFDRKDVKISTFQLVELYPDLILEQYDEEITSNLCDSYNVEFVPGFLTNGFKIINGDSTDYSVVHNVIDDAFHNLDNFV